VALALSVGMRQGELLALHWRDVEVQQRALSVRWNLRYKHGEFIFKEPKTRKSRRRIVLPVEMVDVLRGHRARQKAERLKAGEGWQEHDLVFCTQNGTPLSPGGSLRSAFQRLKRLAGLPAETRFHDLRHTCATLALTDRVNPKVVSEMLGHAKVATTLDIYAHVIPDMQPDVARVMGRLIFSDPHPLEGLPLVTSNSPDGDEGES
jgi:integrase